MRPSRITAASTPLRTAATQVSILGIMPPLIVPSAFSLAMSAGDASVTSEPLYRPFRRILPDFGALDLSPLVVLLIIYILQSIVIPRIALMIAGAAL